MSKSENVMSVCSYSECEVYKSLDKVLNGYSKIKFVAGDLSIKSGVTRSVVVNAIKLLGAAGIAESRSLGVKGTIINVIDMTEWKKLVERVGE